MPREMNIRRFAGSLKVVTKSGAQYNHMMTSAGYALSSAGPVHFGFGANATADVEIRWPSGIVQILKDSRRRSSGRCEGSPLSRSFIGRL